MQFLITKNILFIISFVALWQRGASQQCRMQLICNNSTNADIPIFIQTNGESCDETRVGGCIQQSYITTERFASLEASVNELLVRPSSCSNCEASTISSSSTLAHIESTQMDLCSDSSVNGAQTLSNGQRVFCNNGWTVFQHRFNGSVNFNRSWIEYKMGFGNIEGEFWTGLEWIHEHTRNGGCQLRVDLWDFEDNFAFEEYSSFRLESEDLKYRLYVSGVNGTAGDSFYHVPAVEVVNKNQPFSTWDQDNDNDLFRRNCAKVYAGGWWFNSCTYTSLNNQWGRELGSNYNIGWGTWKGWRVPLKKTMMKLRCD